jgi:hypothetical protein
MAMTFMEMIPECLFVVLTVNLFASYKDLHLESSAPHKVREASK